MKGVASQMTGGRVAFRVAMLLPLVGAASGCQAFMLHALLWGEEPTRTVPAAYPYLADQKVCILVRVDIEHLFTYPHLQLEIGRHVGVALEGNVRGVSVIESRRVVDFQRRDPDWETTDPAALGKRFGADRLLEITLTQYTTREPESSHLYRGHVSATVSVYNTGYPDSAPAYTTEVRTVYPPHGAGQFGTSDREIRRAAMEAFAQDVAGKFYDRKVKVK